MHGHDSQPERHVHQDGLASGDEREQADGSWQPVDLSLHQTGSTVAAARSEVRTVLGGGGLPQVAAFTVAGHHVSLSATSALPAPTIAGSTATYTDALVGGASLVVNNLPNGIEISAVLPTRLSVLPTSWDFPIDLGGLTPVKAVGGQSFSLNDASGATVGQISGAFVKDSTAPMPRLDGFTQNIVTTPAGSVLQIMPDTAYLLNPSTTYPVTIDPSVTEVDSTQGDDTFIWSQPGSGTCPGGSGQQCTNWGGDPWLYVGTWSDGSYSRAEVGFPSGGWLNSDDVVQSAQLGLSNADSYACQTGNNAPRMAVQRIQNHPINQADTWATDAVNNPISGVDVSQSYDTYSEPKGCPANPGGAGDLEYFDITNTVQGWADGAYPNYGLQLITQENTQLSFRQFRSGDANGATGSGTTAMNEGQPILQVTYDNGASNVTSVVPENNSAIVSWSGSPSSPDSYLIAIYNQDNGTLLGTVGVGNQTSAGVQYYNASGGGIGELTNGQNVTFFVYAHNGFGYRPPGSGMTAVIQNYPGAVYGPDGNPSTPPSISAGDSTVTASWTPGNLGGARTVNGYTAFLYTPGTSWPSAATAYCYTGTATTVTFGPGALPANCSGSAPVDGTTYDVEVFEQNQSGNSYQGGTDTGGTALPAGFGPPATSQAATPVGVPGAPTALTVTPSDGTVTLGWTAPAYTGGVPLTTYTVVGYSADDDSQTMTRTVPASTTSLVIANMTDGGSYYFTVSASNGTNSGPVSDYSDYALPQGVPQAPTGVQAAAYDGAALVTWTDPTVTNGGLVAYYNLTATDSNGKTMTTRATDSPTLVTGLTDGTAYTFAVTAVDPMGSSPSSSSSAQTTPTTALLATAATNVAATRGDSTATVTWTAPLVPPSSYTVSVYQQGTGQRLASYQATASGLPNSQQTFALPTGSLDNGTAYLTSVTSNQTSPVPSPTVVSQPATPAGVPVAPPSVDAEPTADGEVTVNWADSDPNGSPVTGYSVTAQPGGATVAETPNGSDEIESAVFDGLTDGTAYTFAVTPTNDVGTGPSTNDTATPSSGGASAAAAPAYTANAQTATTTVPGAPPTTGSAYPGATRAYYMNDITAKNATNLGSAHGCKWSRQGHSGFAVLDYGGAVGTGSTMSPPDGPVLSLATDVTATESFIDGLVACNHSNLKAVVVVGTNNSGSLSTKFGTNLGKSVASVQSYVTGKAAKDNRYSAISVAGGSDIEPSFDGKTNLSRSGTNAVLRAYQKATSNAFYNYGDAFANATGNACKNGLASADTSWCVGDLYYYNGGISPKRFFAIAEAYGSGFGPSYAALDSYAQTGKHKTLFVAGSLTEIGGNSMTNDPKTGWQSILSNVGKYQGGQLPYASDISNANTYHDSPTAKT